MSETLFGGITFETDGAFPFSTDTMVLADFVRLSPKAKVCDLGMGCGTLTFLLKERHPSAVFSGIEIDHTAFELAKQNIISNHLEDCCTPFEGDLRLHLSQYFSANSCTHVVSNPPYFPVGSGQRHQSCQTARGEDCCTLDDICAAAQWLLQYGGTFSLVYRPERLCDLMVSLRNHKLEPKRLQFMRHRPSASVSLVLVEAKLGGKPNLIMEPDLVLHDPAGNPTQDYARIYRLEGANP